MRIKSEPGDESMTNGNGELEGNEIDMPTDLSMSSMSQPMSHHQQQEQPQPLPLHDPPAKYRSHAYSLMKTNQEQSGEDRK